MPTLLGLLDLPVPETVEGVDCSQDIKGNPMHAEHVCFLAACPGRDVFLEDFKKAGKNPMDFGWRGIRTRRYVYVIDVGYKTEPKLVRYLYDLECDPLQMHGEEIKNPEEHAITRELEQKLKTWLQDQNDGFLMHITDGER